MRILPALALAAVLALTGCAGEPDPVATQPDAAPSVTTSATPEAAPEPDGSRAHPYPLGYPARLGRWTVTVTESNLDTTDGEGARSSDPANVYVGATLTATLTDVDGVDPNEAISANASLTPGYVGASGVRYEGHGEYACFTGDSDFWLLPDFYGAGTVTGTTCTAVPVDDVAGGLWAVYGIASDQTVFFQTI